MLLVVRTLTSRKVWAHPVSVINSAPTNREAAAFIQNMAESCPQTKLVLGYSQGAAVVDILTATGRPILGFTPPLPETVADHIAAVAVFGYPSNPIADPVTALSPPYARDAIDMCNGAD